MADNTNLKITAEAFARIVIERWERRIIKLGINSTGNLLKSFSMYVNGQANGNIDYIEFTYAFYGRFVDMGVGRGVKYEKVEYSRRKPQPWYSKIFYHELIQLRRILVEKYQAKAAEAIISVLQD